MKRDFFYSIGLSSKTFSTNFAPILAILILSVITVTPKFYNGAGTYVMVAWIFFFLLELDLINKSSRKLKRILSLGAIFVFLCIIYKLLGVSSASIEYCSARPFLYFAPVIALMVIERCNNEQQVRFLFHFLALAIAINIADNIWLSYDLGIEEIAYQNLSGLMKEEGHTGLNLGGSMFVNMTVFYACLMFMAFLKSHTRQEKYMFFIYIAISVYFIVFCSLKASAVILMLFSFVLMYVSVKSKGKINVIMTVIAILGVLIIISGDTILSLLVNVIGSDRIANRLSFFISGGNVEGGSFVAREELWIVSLKSWLGGIDTFFLGIGDHDWSKFINTAASGIGNHSDLLDVLGRYGFIGALVLYSSIKIYYDYFKSKYGISFKWEILSFFILLILMGLTKKFMASQPPIIIFILLPLTVKYISVQNKNG